MIGAPPKHLLAHDSGGSGDHDVCCDLVGGLGVGRAVQLVNRCQPATTVTLAPVLCVTSRCAELVSKPTHPYPPSLSMENSRQFWLNFTLS
jgi:hypothetical protein